MPEPRHEETNAGPGTGRLSKEYGVMNRTISVMAAAMGMAGLVGSATASADDKPIPRDNGSACHEVIGHCVQSVIVRWVQETNGKRTRHLAGVDIRIDAEPGLTAEYLTVEARRAAAAAPSATDSVFGVDGSQIDVRSTGDGFVVHVMAADPTHAREIVRRGRLLG
jgi:hypothetical protein